MKGSLELFLSRLSPQLAQVYGSGTTSDLETERESHWQARPWGLKWRSSVAFVTFVVGLGITTDSIVYSIVITDLPFYLEGLGYTGVSGLVGWLLFAYSAGLAIMTPIIAHISEHHTLRQSPLVVGCFTLIGAQIMLMLAPTYWVMVLARLIQGIGSAMIWTVGLALLCDTVPQKDVGRQLGLAMSGLSIGLLVGLPLGGALYGRWGYHAPFYFGIIVTFIDLISRLLVIERKDAIRWGVDPASSGTVDAEKELDGKASESAGMGETCGGMSSAHELEESTVEGRVVGGVTGDQGTDEKERNEGEKEVQASTAPRTNESSTASRNKDLSILKVVAILMNTPRATTVFFFIMVYGVMYGGQNSIVTLHLQAIWNLNSTKVGLVTLASVIPTLISSPMVGWLADRKGNEWATAIGLILALPWWGLITINVSLALFIVCFALESMLMSAVLSPVSSELATVSRTIDGIGYAHVYGAFNFVYGIGASIGPVLGGQMYQHVPHNRGWLAFNFVAFGLVIVSIALTFAYTGDRPLAGRLRTRLSGVWRRDRKIET